MWRLKWNKIILATKTILFHFRRGSMFKNTKHFRVFWNNFILTWNHGLSYVTKTMVTVSKDTASKSSKHAKGAKHCSLWFM